MKKAVVAIIIIVVIGIGSFVFLGRRNQSSLSVEGGFASSGKLLTHMLLTSPSFQSSGFVPVKFTCDGGDINPELQIQNVPAEAKSLALIMDDPDAPGRTFTHWLVWNINPKTTVIKQESRPPGLPAEAGAKAGVLEGKTDFGRVGYSGPCPPAGKPHRYFFKLYALDSKPELSEGSTKEELEIAMKDHIITSAELIGIYKR